MAQDFQEGEEVKFNHSRLDTYRRCPRKYWWESVQNLVPRRDSVPLLVGDAVHRGLAAHYAGKVEADIESAAREAFNEVRAKSDFLQGELDDLAAQEEYVVNIMRWYRTEYPKEEWIVLAPEVQGSFPLGNHLFFFRADGLVSWHGFTWLLEHKTTSALGDIFFKKFRTDGQMSAYIYAVGTQLDHRPKGAIINAIRKSKKLDRADFARDVVMRTDVQLDSYMGQVQSELDVIAELNPADKDDWIQHTHECVAFNRVCTYVELCVKDRPAIRESFTKREKDYVDLGGD